MSFDVPGFVASSAALMLLLEDNTQTEDDQVLAAILLLLRNYEKAEVSKLITPHLGGVHNHLVSVWHIVLRHCPDFVHLEVAETNEINAVLQYLPNDWWGKTLLIWNLREVWPHATRPWLPRPHAEIRVIEQSLQDNLAAYPHPPPGTLPLADQDREDLALRALEILCWLDLTTFGSIDGVIAPGILDHLMATIALPLAYLASREKDAGLPVEIRNLYRFYLRYPSFMRVICIPDKYQLTADDLANGFDIHTPIVPVPAPIGGDPRYVFYATVPDVFNHLIGYLHAVPQAVIAPDDGNLRQIQHYLDNHYGGNNFDRLQLRRVYDLICSYVYSTASSHLALLLPARVINQHYLVVDFLIYEERPAIRPMPPAMSDLYAIRTTRRGNPAFKRTVDLMQRWIVSITDGGLITLGIREIFKEFKLLIQKNVENQYDNEKVVVDHEDYFILFHRMEEGFIVNCDAIDLHNTHIPITDMRLQVVQLWNEATNSIDIMVTNYVMVKNNLRAVFYMMSILVAKRDPTAVQAADVILKTLDDHHAVFCWITELPNCYILRAFYYLATSPLALSVNQLRALIRSMADMPNFEWKARLVFLLLEWYYFNHDFVNRIYLNNVEQQYRKMLLAAVPQAAFLVGTIAQQLAARSELLIYATILYQGNTAQSMGGGAGGQPVPISIDAVKRLIWMDLPTYVGMHTYPILPEYQTYHLFIELQTMYEMFNDPDTYIPFPEAIPTVFALLSPAPMLVLPNVPQEVINLALAIKNRIAFDRAPPHVLQEVAELQALLTEIQGIPNEPLKNTLGTVLLQYIHLFRPDSRVFFSSFERACYHHYAILRPINDNSLGGDLSQLIRADNQADRSTYVTRARTRTGAYGRYPLTHRFLIDKLLKDLTATLRSTHTVAGTNLFFGMHAAHVVHHIPPPLPVIIPTGPIHVKPLPQVGQMFGYEVGTIKIPSDRERWEHEQQAVLHSYAPEGEPREAGPTVLPLTGASRNKAGTTYNRYFFGTLPI